MSETPEQRTVKFRAYDLEHHHMYANAYPFEHLVYVEMDPNDPEVKPFESKMHKVNGKWFYFVVAKDMALMQYTGLHDKNGKDICEGDILSCSYDKSIRLRDEHVWPHEEFVVTPDERKCEVYWSDGSFKLFDHGTHDWMLLEVANVKEMAILGNIYDNADLVPQEKIRRHLKMIY